MINIPAIKIYRCCICHQVLEKSKPIRITINVYGASRYKQYAPVINYDICLKCYDTFNDWIKKNKEEE